MSTISTTQLIPSEADFGSLFNQLIPPQSLHELIWQHRRSAVGAPPRLQDPELIAGLVFHVF
jgi:hypothetical protein